MDSMVFAKEDRCFEEVEYCQWYTQWWIAESQHPGGDVRHQNCEQQ